MKTMDRGADRVGPAKEPSVWMPGDRLVTTKVAAERTGWAYSLFEVEVGTGGGEAPHIQHREDEYLYVIEGRFGFLVEGVVSEAGPGTRRLLVVHTPGGSQESFLAAVGEPTTASADRTGRNHQGFALLAAEHGIELCEATERAERSY